MTSIERFQAFQVEAVRERFDADLRIQPDGKGDDRRDSKRPGFQPAPTADSAQRHAQRHARTARG